MLTIGDGTYQVMKNEHFSRCFSIVRLEILQREESGDLVLSDTLHNSPDFDTRLRVLVGDCKKLNIDAVGDVVAYCCLVLHGDFVMQRSEVWPPVSEIIQATEIPAEDRFHAVNLLLPPSVHAAVFGTPD